MNVAQIANPALNEQFQRCLAEVGDSDPYTGRTTIGIKDVLRAHFLILDYFLADGTEGFGGIGPRDLNLLHSALSRQQTGFDGTPKYSDEIDVCATLFFGLINNHPFHDANKRTALLVVLFHLNRIGRCPAEGIRQREFDTIAVRTASHQFSEYKDFKRFVRLQSGDREVAFLSDWLRRHTRPIDLKNYTVTFHELNTILGRFNCRLANPSGNYIDVLRQVEERYFEFLVIPRRRMIEKKVAQIGFPGWKKQVNPSAIKTVRNECGLIPENGIDSQVFFKGADIMDALIDKFNGPLRRLARK